MRVPWFLWALCLAASAMGQPSAPEMQHNLPVPLSRKIAFMVRSQFAVPSDCDIDIESRAPSTTAGFDTLHVTLRRGAESATVDFLISSDDKTLVRMEKFDLNGNPALAINIQDRPIRGNPVAPVTIIGFDDLECPVCAKEVPDASFKKLFLDTPARFGSSTRTIRCSTSIPGHSMPRSTRTVSPTRPQTRIGIMWITSTVTERKWPENLATWVKAIPFWIASPAVES